MSEMIYHATYETHLDSIEESGLKPGTYFANTAGYAAAFLAIRGGVEHRGAIEKEIDGKIERFPDIVVHKGAHVFAVATEDVERWLAPSYDHSASFYPDDLDCWIVDCAIDSELLTYVGYIEFPK